MPSRRPRTWGEALRDPEYVIPALTGVAAALSFMGLVTRVPADALPYVCGGWTAFIAFVFYQFGRP